MRNRVVQIVVVLGILFVGTVFFKFNNSIHPRGSINNPEVITKVDNVLMNPARFTGYMAVEGKVVMVDNAKSMFGLGCSDGCLILPVKYSGTIPPKDSDVTVYGEVRKIEGGRYIFESQKVKVN